jgi:hypothetical protein
MGWRVCEFGWDVGAVPLRAGLMLTLVEISELKAELRAAAIPLRAGLLRAQEGLSQLVRELRIANRKFEISNWMQGTWNAAKVEG